MADVVERYRIVGENAVGAAFNQILRQSKSTADRMAGHFRQAFGTISAVAIGRTLLTWNKQAIENADAIGTLAEAFGTTTEELSRFDYAARQNNTTLEQLTPGLTAFQKNLVLAGEDSGRAQKALAALNVDADRLARMPLPRQLEAIADAFRGVENPADRVRIAAQLFGDEVGRRMIPILARGRDGLRALGDESDRTGNTLTKEFADKLRATDAAMKEVEAQSLLLKRELAVGLGPAVTELGKLFNITAKGALNFGEALAEAFHGADEPVRILQDRLAGLAERRSELLKRIGTAESMGASSEFIGKARKELLDVEAAMNRANSALQQFGRDAQAYEQGSQAAADATRKLADGMGALVPIVVTATKLVDPLANKYSVTATELEKATAAHRDFRAELERELERHDIDQETFNKRLDEHLNRAIPEVEVTAKKIDEHIKQVDRLSVFAEQAARNMQSAFADFLFDPFDKGLKGMLKGFIDILRRMIAETAAAQIFEARGFGKSGGGGFGSILGGLFGGLGGGGGPRLPPGSVPTVPGMRFGGFMAGGGVLSPGEFGVVGEEGLEFAIGGTHGQTIVPMSKAAVGRNVTIAPVFAPVINVDSRTDREAVRQEIGRTMQEGFREYQKFFRDQVSRGALTT